MAASIRKQACNNYKRDNKTRADTQQHLPGKFVFLRGSVFGALHITFLSGTTMRQLFCRDSLLAGKLVMSVNATSLGAHLSVDNSIALRIDALPLIVGIFTLPSVMSPSLQTVLR